MRILSCCPITYYGSHHGITLSYDLFVRVPRLLGHTVVSYDYMADALISKEEMNDHFLSLIKGGGFDFVIIETAAAQFYPDILNQARSILPLIAWNSDDDFRWSTYSESQYKSYSLMYTTSSAVYNAIKGKYTRLRYSQWGCAGYKINSDDIGKDIDVSFCGSLKAQRVKEIKKIENNGCRMYIRGMGSEKLANSGKELGNIVLRRLMRGRNSGFRKELQRWVMARFGNKTGGITYNELHRIWKSSRIIYTPLRLEDSQLELKRAQYKKLGIEHCSDDKFQCKSRIFEQGLSGGLMLINKTSIVVELYRPGIDYVDYTDVEECSEKIKYYLVHEKERKAIARNYYERTTEKHMWRDRFAKITKEVREIL